MLAIGLVIGYSFLQPYLSRQFGWNLPQLDGRRNGAQQVDASSEGQQAIVSAFDARQSDLIVECDVEVMKVLRDDNEGHRHQKALLRLSNGHTVLLAHNIDLAKRVPFNKGDTIKLRGEYEYNEQGGVIHWTHHAPPRSNHIPGWIEFQGKRYE